MSEAWFPLAGAFGAPDAGREGIRRTRARKPHVSRRVTFMADPLHVAKLCEGARAWNLWRDRNPHVVPDLDGAVLTPGERRPELEDGPPADLHRARLTGADLRHMCLAGADLGGAALTGARLDGARLERANLGGADLTGAILDGADLAGTRLDGAIVNGARLAGARNLTQSQIDRCFGDQRTRIPPGLSVPVNWYVRSARLPASGTMGTRASSDAGLPDPAAKVTDGIFRTLAEARANLHRTLETGRKVQAMNAASPSKEKDGGRDQPAAVRPRRRRFYLLAGVLLVLAAAVLSVLLLSDVAGFTVSAGSGFWRSFLPR